MGFVKRITTARPFSKSKSKELQKAFESDRGRIINSAAIRRLQQKTQVFPLERNAVVRSRLTHSMEVLQVGRFIVQKIAAKYHDEQHLDKHGFLNFAREIETLVEMACLLHDVGNPPFGHFGEFAISQWFNKFIDEHPLHSHFEQSELSTLASIMTADLSCFEGNAQAIRLIHSLLRFNLTYSQSACVIKYTRAAFEPKIKGQYLKKKPGFYLSEKAFIDDLYETLDMTTGSRFPLTYIMEAADDISYGLADMEDAVEKGIFTFEVLASKLKEYFARACADKGMLKQPSFTHFNKCYTFNEIIDDCVDKAGKEPINQTHEFFVRLRVKFNHILVESASQQFIDHQDAIFEGSFDRGLLLDGKEHELLLDTFSKLSIEHIFSHKEVETLELQGNKILTALLNEYSPLLLLESEEFHKLLTGEIKRPVEHRLFKRLPKQYVSAYKEALKEENIKSLLESVNWSGGIENTTALWERYFRCRLVIDFISGMTDQYALDEYHALCAIK